MSSFSHPHHRASVLSILLITCALLGGLFFFELFSTGTVVILVVTVLLVLIAGDRLWMGAVAIPVAVPIGILTTIVVNRSYRYEITAVEVLLLLLAVALAYAFLWHVVDWPSTHAIEVILCVWLSLAYASLLWIVDAQQYLVAVRVFTYHVLAFIISAALFGNARARAWVLPSIVATSGMMALQLIQTITHLGSVTKILTERSTITTPVGPLATVVAILVLFLPFVVIQGYRTTGWPRWASWTVAGLSVIAIVMSIGKAAILITAASLWYLFSKLGKGTVFLKRAAVIAAIGLLLSGAVSTIPALVVERFSAITSGETSRLRIEEAMTGLEVFRRNIVHGVGAGNLIYYYQRLLNGYSGISNVLVVQVAAEYGLIGLALLGFLLYHIRLLVRRLSVQVIGHRDRLILVGLQASILAMVLYAFLEVTFLALSYGILFWWLMGYLVAWEHSVRVLHSGSAQ